MPPQPADAEDLDTVGQPSRRAANTAGKTPRTPRTRPSSANSPNDTGTVAETERGDVFAYLTLRHEERVLNVGIPSKREACNLSALLLDIADHLE